MPQRTIHRSLAEATRTKTVAKLPRVLGTLTIALVLVLLITNGGAG